MDMKILICLEQMWTAEPATLDVFRLLKDKTHSESAYTRHL